jgi:2-polyprenyl-6-methoxyphenol hydroxylase-like FAD-dependent oxidoreductase
MTTAQPNHLAIIGASLTGLFAAAAASAAGWRVTLIERDHLPATAQPRRGVPQSQQGHVLLYRGLLSIEQLLPGMRAELAGLGAPSFRSGLLPLLSDEGWVPTGEHGFELVCVSRPLLEHVVRRRVLALPLIDLVSGVRAHRLRRDGQGWHVELLAHPSPDGEQSSSVPTAAHPGAGDLAPVLADVVVDASGRSSRLPHWLDDLGVSPARVSTVDAKMAYATRRYRADRAPGPGVVVATTPKGRRGCVIGPIEDGQWLVSAVGAGEHRPGRDEAAFLTHLRELPDPAPWNLVKGMTPVGDVLVHRQTGNVRHHYEAVPDWPAGLLALGDSACAFNPTYGQGMTVAASQAVLLGRLLREGWTGQTTTATRQAQRRLVHTADVPWMMCTSQDRQFLEHSESAKPVEALVGRWAAEVSRLALSGDRRAVVSLQEVAHLMASPIILLHPALLLTSIRLHVTARRRARRRHRTAAALTPASR